MKKFKLDRIISIATLLAFSIIGILSKKYRLLEGNELIENFFFAQFAATAALLVFAILLFRSKLPFGRWLIAAIVATHVLGWIYTPCAIELALACAAFRALAFLDAPSPRSAALTVITGLTLCAVAVIHPTMIGSLVIAANALFNDRSEQLPAPALRGCRQRSATYSSLCVGWGRAHPPISPVNVFGPEPRPSPGRGSPLPPGTGSAPGPGRHYALRKWAFLNLHRRSRNPGCAVAR